MKLYAHRYCPYSRRVRIALAEHGAEYEYIELAPTAEYPPELRGKVPGNNGVPVLLVRDDFALWDSTAIVHWVDSAHPRSLYPSQRDPQAQARGWQGWITTKLYPALKDLRGDDEGKKAAAAYTIVETLRSIETMIGDQWLVDDFSIADLAVAPVVAELSSQQIESLTPRVRAYVGRLRARPSVREVCELDLPDNERPSAAA